MKILIITQYFYPENFRINDLASKLNDRNHQITVLTGMPNYPSGKIHDGYPKFTTRREFIGSVEVIRVPLIPRRKGRSLNLILNYLSFVISASIFSPFLLRGRNFDVIFSPSYSPATANIPALLLKVQKKIPLIVWIQDLWPQSLTATGSIRSSFILRMVEVMMLWIYKNTDLILIQSKAFRGPILELLNCNEKIRYFPNWAEDIFQPVPKTDDSNLPKGFNVMFAGNLGAGQSLEVIIQAAEILRNSAINWIILGDGRQAEWLSAEVRNKDLTHCVYQLGRKSVKSMPSYFSQADAMLVTLSSDPNVGTTIPGKIQSYLACGRPIIGALNGEGAKVITDSGSGFAVPAGDHIKLAEAVSLMASLSEQQRDHLGANGLEYYKRNFSSSELISLLEDDIKSLMDDEL